MTKTDSPSISAIRLARESVASLMSVVEDQLEGITDAMLDSSDDGTPAPCDKVAQRVTRLSGELRRLFALEERNFCLDADSKERETNTLDICVEQYHLLWQLDSMLDHLGSPMQAASWVDLEARYRRFVRHLTDHEDRKSRLIGIRLPEVGALLSDSGAAAGP